MGKDILKALAWILICANYFTACAECAPESFVDKWVYETPPFEEDPADEFLDEKREINQICAVEKAKDLDADFRELQLKLKELRTKEFKRYGEKYEDWDVIFVFGRQSAWNWENELWKNFQRRTEGLDGNDLKKFLQNEKTWQDFQYELDKTTRGFDVPVELNFRLDKKFVALCGKVLGEDDPVTLKHKINLIQDYSLMGDSKIALEMENELLPTMEKVFGKNSREVAELLSLMANDYKISGDYGRSEKTLLKSIKINRELHGEESSPELLAELVALIKLRKATPSSDSELYEELEKAAKNFSEDKNVLYGSGYHHIKILNGSVNDTSKLANLATSDATARDLIETRHREEFVKFIDMTFERAELYKEFGAYDFSLQLDLTAVSDCKATLGNYHHKTLTALCNLSDDYLILNQPEESEALAQDAFKTSQKIYGDEHPCTLYTIHSLTNVYRKKGLYNDALSKDLAAYDLCKKVFVKNSAGEPFEILQVLADIADDYNGLKNYPLAIKYYEEFLAKSPKNIVQAKAAEVRKNLACLYNLNGDYGKTVNLYSFLKADGNAYSLDKLQVNGLTAAHTADALAVALTAVGQKEAAAQIYSQELIEFEEVRFFNNSSFATSENKREWFAQSVPYYKKAAAFFVNENKDAEAFREVELCKGRTLADQYNDLLALYKGGLNEEEIQKLREYQEKIAWYKDKLKETINHGSDALKFNLGMTQLKIINECRVYNAKLREKYPKYREALESGKNYGLSNSLIKSKTMSEYLLYKDQFSKKYQTLENSLFFNPEQLKALIPQDHCYISFSTAKKDEQSNTLANEILLFVVDDSGQVKSSGIAVDDKFFEQCKLYHDLNSYSNIREMNIKGKKYLRLINGEYVIDAGREKSNATSIKAKDDPDGAKWRELRQKISEELSEKLMPFLEENAGSSSHWIISPDAELNLVPFETLIYRGKLLIESKDVSYVPSLAVMKLMREVGETNIKITNRKEFFAMGNPIYIQEDELDDKDLEKISPLFESKSIFKREQATEKNLRKLNASGELLTYKYLLFSAHGKFVPAKPEDSSIILSQGFNDADTDDRVTVGEWMGYDLRSDLIYLSACESGRGDYQAGEGIIGIPYALTVAGNKDTVMSLWKVKNDATAEFTSTFFEKLRDGKTESAALNETKREFLRKSDLIYRDPSVWAAFLLYGI